MTNKETNMEKKCGTCNCWDREYEVCNNPACPRSYEDVGENDFCETGYSPTQTNAQNMRCICVKATKLADRP